MDKDFSPVADGLAAADLDGYLVDAAADVGDQRYLSEFGAHDPFVTLYTPDATAVLVSGMEYARAADESRADAVRRWGDYDDAGDADGGDVDEDTSDDQPADADEDDGGNGRGETLAAFLAEFGADAVAVPDRFPLQTAEQLRAAGVTVDRDEEGLVGQAREVKTDAEVAEIRRAQAANDAAMARAREVIAGAAVDDGTLYHDGDPLTSERVKRAIDRALLDRGCRAHGTIVACGADAAQPHNRGSGPLRAGETIVIDIFPQYEASGYHADMTRTYVRGDPTDAARDFYEATLAAQDAALSAVGPDATGADVHDAVCDVYGERGYATPRDDDSDTGFIHGTGHGVGLDVHEGPGLGGNGTALEPGHVVTVEPGLYDPEVGGVRIEDLVVVTEDGHENLTDAERTFSV